MVQFLLEGKTWPEPDTYIRPPHEDSTPEENTSSVTVDPRGTQDLEAIVEQHVRQSLEKSSSEGYPDQNPKTRFGVKKAPLHLVPPSALYAMAEAFKVGGEKYGPYNWREASISSSVYYAAALRHLTAWWDGEDLDPETGNEHIWHAMACLALLVDGKAAGKLNDDRPPAIKGNK